MTSIVRSLTKLGILKNDLDYHLLRASMVIIFLFFGYQKWFEYEAQALLPYIGHGPLIFWLYAVFGVRGQPISSELQSGCLGCFCSPGIGTKD